MGRLKFSRARLLESKAKIDIMTMQLREDIDEAAAAVNRLEPEKRSMLSKAVTETADGIDRLRIMSAKLVELAELYNKCGRGVEDLVWRLASAPPR